MNQFKKKGGELYGKKEQKKKAQGENWNCARW